MVEKDIVKAKTSYEIGFLEDQKANLSPALSGINTPNST
jgi:hypothetical protein